ncbi:4'-phosphopantetheinyl transferase family protein [Amycolatopsis jiangsuensis]|uniref:4'-phosphopantetheinyl transferase n=1 Tax=Amycolatopsis jiangsuensis TaxID=1181879 RepID=A0A840IRJ4_9PSEU|nr:4'-phosphopantetheinyl transferase superfamily protein [Amycolatopsis jiangsuensis]MBB4683788.1 4'-phosphopantetheinyl transferase [Amycolatopsis jiangsuensis]
MTMWSPAWRQPSGALGERLEPGRDVHVWRIALARVLAPGDAYGLLGGLSEDELRRAAQFVVEEERIRFLASHVALRQVLACYTGAGPRAVGLTYDGGRPVLAGRTGLEFSLSRSGGLALVAVASGVRVGVDVEEVRPVDHTGLAERTLTVGEAAGVAGPETFFRYWACKEAALKADGTGLAGLPGPAFTLTGDDVVFTGTDRPEWTIRELGAGPRHAAALAVQARPVTVRAFDWLPAGAHQEGVPR